MCVRQEKGADGTKGERARARTISIFDFRFCSAVYFNFRMTDVPIFFGERGPSMLF